MQTEMCRCYWPQIINIYNYAAVILYLLEFLDFLVTYTKVSLSKSYKNLENLFRTYNFKFIILKTLNSSVNIR